MSFPLFEGYTILDSKRFHRAADAFEARVRQDEGQTDPYNFDPQAEWRIRDRVSRETELVGGMKDFLSSKHDFIQALLENLPLHAAIQAIVHMVWADDWNDSALRHTVIWNWLADQTFEGRALESLMDFAKGLRLRREFDSGH